MPKKSDSGKLSKPTVLRLSEYLLILEHFLKEGKESFSSRELADLYGNTASQVRQDVFHLNNSGRVGQGYSTWELTQSIRHALGMDELKKVCVVGVGNLGRAISTHIPFNHYGMRLTAAFDVDPEIVGTKINDVPIFHLDQLPEIIEKGRISIAALCVPSTVAQGCAEGLVESGIKGILNYSRIRLKVPDHITVQYQQVICSFMQLSYSVSDHQTE